MHDIRHRVGINAPHGDVFDAIATREGLARWWTSAVDGESRVGEDLTFHFGNPDPAAVMKVTDLVPGTRVAWECTAGPDEWLGTTFTYDFKREGDTTVVLFTNAGWREPVEFMHHCSTKWAYFLLGMKDGLEGGKATPWPDDKPIDNWG